MPPNEKCPSCGVELADWHREWLNLLDQQKVFQGTAGLECPLCGATAMHARWAVPLTLPSPAALAPKVKRDVVKAARWAVHHHGMPLADYLKTVEGKPYAGSWTDVEVQQADHKAATTP